MNASPHTGANHKICLMQWVHCILQFCFSGFQMLLQFSLWCLLKERSFIGKEQQECTQPCHTHLDRSSLFHQFHGLFLFTPSLFLLSSYLWLLMDLQVGIEIPYVLIQAIIYGIIVYSMIGFEWTVAKFFWYLFFMFFTLLYFTYYGMMAVGLTPNYNIASIVSSAFYGLWNLFSGFIIPRPVSSNTLLY